jgi:hypothetical protein
MVSARFETPAWSGFLLTLALLAPRAIAADSVESVQKAASEWAELRAETVRLESDWQWQRETLTASLTGLNARITTLEQEREEIKATITREEGGSGDLVQRNAEATAALETIEQRLQTTVTRIEHLRPFLPPRLSQALELPYRSIRDEKLGPAERMQHLMTIFNRCGAFNKSITVGEEELKLEGEESARLLEVIYWGLAYGYALDRSRSRAYFGHPGSAGWVWEPRPASAADVALLIDIHSETSDPAFVGVPTRVSEPFPAQR